MMRRALYCPSDRSPSPRRTPRLSVIATRLIAQEQYSALDRRCLERLGPRFGVQIPIAVAEEISLFVKELFVLPRPAGSCPDISVALVNDILPRVWPQKRQMLRTCDARAESRQLLPEQKFAAPQTTEIF